MANIHLYKNTSQLTIPATLGVGNGKKIDMAVFPGEAWFDSNGYIRFFSLRLNDGKICNLKLIPNNQTQDNILRLCNDFLLPIGLKVVGDEIFYGTRLVDNLAKFILNKGGKFLINDIFEKYSIQNSSFFEITTGERVILHHIRLNLG